MYSSVIVFTLCVGVGLSATIPMITPFNGCIHNGTHYYFGQTFQPNPCEHCSCVRSGQTQCLQTACRFPACVDSVQDPTECCPTCPNGENCRHSDGTIVKKGEVYHPDILTTCMCESTDFGFTTQSTICNSILPGPVQGQQ